MRLVIFLQNQPKLFSDGREIIDYGRNFFGMDTEHFMALQAVHGAVHAARIGLKYTWFGPGYISNVYFKMIAGTPMYLPMQNGGDLSFMSCTTDDGQKVPIRDKAVGDLDGNPVVRTGW